jgi:hypothetical protein
MIPDECANLLTSTRYFYEEDNPVLAGRRIRVKINVTSGFIWSKLKGKVTHWKRKGAKWKRKRADLKISIDGPQQSPNCELQEQYWSDYKGYEKRKTLRVRDRVALVRREAFVDDGDPRWPTERCWSIAFIDKNDNNIFPVALGR